VCGETEAGEIEGGEGGEAKKAEGGKTYQMKAVATRGGRSRGTGRRRRHACGVVGLPVCGL
jgi:hypothetical protein